MTKAEAKRYVCRCAALILDNDSDNEWLNTGADGNEMPEADAKRVSDAFDALVRELHRRGAGRCNSGR